MSAETSKQRIVVGESFCGETFWFPEEDAKKWCFSNLIVESRLYHYKSCWIIIRNSLFDSLGSQISDTDALAWFLKHETMPPDELEQIASRNKV